jgi:hypothetical protein
MFLISGQATLAGQGSEISNQLLNELRNLKKYLI